MHYFSYRVNCRCSIFVVSFTPTVVLRILFLFCTQAFFFFFNLFNLHCRIMQYCRFLLSFVRCCLHFFLVAFIINLSFQSDYLPLPFLLSFSILSPFFYGLSFSILALGFFSTLSTFNVALCSIVVFLFCCRVLPSLSTYHFPI